MNAVRYIVGDSLSVLRDLPDGSVDLVVCSPPFLALRAYLPADHPDKDHEMGSEPTPGAFVDALLDVVEECRRVLTPRGSLALELGDTYCADRAARVPRWSATNQAGWPLAKSLCLVPELVRVSLAYGVNPLTGRQTERWRVRNVVRWARPNPPVGGLGDKYRPSTSDILIACTSGRRWFDLDAVRTETKDPDKVGGSPRRQTFPRRNGHGDGDPMFAGRTLVSNPNGAPPLDTWWHDAYDQDAWNIPTQPYKGAHYATWPEALVRPLVLSMCPEKVCRECGEPSRRIVERTPEYEEARRRTGGLRRTDSTGRSTAGRKSNGHDSDFVSLLTLGWTECGCGPGCSPTTWKQVTVPAYYLDGKLITAERTVTVVDDLGSCDGSHWRPGVVLDPFAGTGTTLKVAVDLGRDAIGIDIDERNLPQAWERVGLRLGMEWHEEVHRPQVVTR